MPDAPGETLRLFVALELPEAVRRAVSQWSVSELARTGGLRLVADEALHVTLCFLGARPASELDAITVACREAAAGHGPLRLSLGRTLALPRRRPRVVAVGIAGVADVADVVGMGDTRHAGASGPVGGLDGVGALDELDKLDKLQTALSRRLAAGGWYRPEPRPFLAHVTVARVRSHSRIDARTLDGLRPIEAPGFVADTVTVFRSRTSPGGARYEALMRAGLAAGA